MQQASGVIKWRGSTEKNIQQCFDVELELELYISIAQIKHNKHIECALQYFQAYDNKVP